MGRIICADFHSASVSKNNGRIEVACGSELIMDVTGRCCCRPPQKYKVGLGPWVLYYKNYLTPSFASCYVRAICPFKAKYSLVDIHREHETRNFRFLTEAHKQQILDEGKLISYRFFSVQLDNGYVRFGSIIDFTLDDGTMRITIDGVPLEIERK